MLKRFYVFLFLFERFFTSMVCKRLAIRNLSRQSVAASINQSINQLNSSYCRC